MRKPILNEIEQEREGLKKESVLLGVDRKGSRIHTRFLQVICVEGIFRMLE
jgi:hypothetical protein